MKIAPEVLGSDEETATITSQFALTIFFAKVVALAESELLSHIEKLSSCWKKSKNHPPIFEIIQWVTF